MKLLYEWGIPAAGFLIWIVLTFAIVPAFMHLLREKEFRRLTQPDMGNFPTLIGFAMELTGRITIETSIGAMALLVSIEYK
jgi:hypothetical protein